MIHKPLNVRIVAEDDVALKRRPANSEARERGVKYEKQVQAHLKELLGDEYQANPWIAFNLLGIGDTLHRQPDGLLIGPQSVYIVEIKTTHCIDAYRQLMEIYVPLVSVLFPEKDIRLVEVARYIDTSIPFPHGHEWIDDPRMAPLAPCVGLYRYYPRVNDRTSDLGPQTAAGATLGNA